MTTMDVQIKDVRFGHDSTAPADVGNVRLVGRETGIEELAASIEAHGLIQPLTVVRSEVGPWYVVDGNRRLAAVHRLIAAGKMAETDAIAVTICPDEASAKEVGLAANTVRAPLHEADQYVAFRDLADSGSTEEDIAGRFGIESRRVRRMLALGRLAPAILDAWRSGEFQRDQVECVRAFTLAPSLKDQERAFAKLKKSGHLYPHVIRQEFGAGNREAQKLVAFIGRIAYRAAGGSLVEDLFGENHVVSDPALAARLAGEKLQAECAKLLEQGWSWASPVAELPDGASWSWASVSPKSVKATRAETKRMKELAAIVEAINDDDEGHEAAETEIAEIKAAQDARAFADEDKARSGCIVEIGHSGKLVVRFGKVKPGREKADKGKTSKANTDSGEKASPTISNALVHRLSVSMTRGVQEAIKASPHAALAALISGAEVGSYGSPVRVRLEGLAAPVVARDAEPFAAVFERLVALSTDDLMHAAAQVVGRALDFQAHTAEHAPAGRADVQILVGSIEAGAVARELAAAFDAADYFGSASKPLVLRAIEEAVNADEARKAGKLKKAELVEFAVANVCGKGWLPPEIRPPSYAGPGASVPAEFQQAAE